MHRYKHTFKLKMPNPKLIRSIFFILFFGLLSVPTWGQKKLYVSASGTADGDGTVAQPYGTLRQAVREVPGVLTEPYTILLDGSDGPISLGDASVIISVRGTSTNKLTIKSLGCRATVEHPIGSNRFIQIKASSYVTIEHIHFRYCMPKAIHMRNASDHITIRYCEFSGEFPVPYQSTGVIVLEGDEGITHHCKVNYNLFRDLHYTLATNQHQVIYISENAHDNTIFGNTIYNTLSYAIHGWHCNYQRNKVSRNCIQQYPFVNDNNVRAMHFGIDWDGSNESPNGIDCPNPHFIKDNWAYRNYVYEPNWPNILTIDQALTPAQYNNKGWLNRQYPHLKPKDPYWMNYQKTSIENTVVAADFDQDGDADIAAFKQVGGNGMLDMWFSYQDHEAFVYSSDKPWWYQPYSVGSIKGRVVAAELSGDHYPDIVAFREVGPNETAIDIWVNNNALNLNSFTRVPGTPFQGYSADKIKDRVVSGDFNHDGIDDLATLYDYGAQHSRIHVWLAGGGTLNYQGNMGWWDGPNYPAADVNNRFVSGDFNGDGKDDIAAIRDDGSGSFNCKIDVFLSNGSSFTQHTWWYGVLDGSKMSGRVVVGDFAGDDKDDIAVLYDDAPGFTKIKVWTSNANGNGFQTSGNFWTASGYNASRTTDAVVAGKFSSDHEKWHKDGIAAFYNYQNCISTRTHVWVPKTNTNGFYRSNSAMGYPWLLYESFYGRKKGTSTHLAPVENEAGTFFKITPNPSNGRLSLSFQNKQSGTLSVHNLQHKTLLEQPFNEQQHLPLDLSHLSDGIYIVTVMTTEGQRFTHKVVIHH